MKKKLIIIFASIFLLNVIYLFPNSNKFITTSKNGLNIRSAPDRSTTIIGVIPANEEIISSKQSQNIEIIDGVKSFWFYVKYKNFEGWVFGGFLKKSQSINDDIININSTGINSLKMGESFDKFVKSIKHDSVQKNDSGIWTLYKNNNPLISICDKNGGKDKIVIWAEIYSNIFKINGSTSIGDPIEKFLKVFPCTEIKYNMMTGEAFFDITSYNELNKSFSNIFVYVKSNDKNKHIIIDETNEYITKGKTNKFHKNGIINKIYIQK